MKDEGGKRREQRGKGYFFSMLVLGFQCVTFTWISARLVLAIPDWYACFVFLIY